VHCVLISTNLLILFGIREKCSSSGRDLLLYLFIKMVIKLAVVIIEGCHCYQLYTVHYHIFLCEGQVHM
jgi:hypothetical protein